MDKVLRIYFESDTMTISLPFQKLMIALRIRHLAEKTQATLREVSQVLGMMVAINQPSYQPQYITDT